jgi:hypothetical protein
MLLALAAAAVSACQRARAEPSPAGVAAATDREVEKGAGVLAALPSRWTNLESRGGGLVIVDRCVAVAKEVRIIDAAGTKPRLRVSDGQSGEEYLVLRAEAVAAAPQRTVRLEIERRFVAPATRHIVQLQFTDPERGLATWSEPTQPAGGRRAFLAAGEPYVHQEKIGRYERPIPTGCATP